MNAGNAAEVVVERRGAEAVMVCRGALDMSISDILRNSIIALTAEEDEVTIDMTSTTFIDTAVLSDLVVGARTMLRRGKRLKVIAAKNSHPLRTLEIVGFSVVMDIEVVPAVAEKDKCNSTTTSAS